MTPAPVIFTPTRLAPITTLLFSTPLRHPSRLIASPLAGFKMLPSTFFSFLIFGLASITSIIAEKDFFVITSCPSIALSRIDPIVDPGRVSAHVHNICGGSGFGRESTMLSCSVTRVYADAYLPFMPIVPHHRKFAYLLLDPHSDDRPTANLLSPDQQAGASCSSALVGDDKSNYWSP